MFQEVTKADGVNVVICTHNDADHAEGVLGFLEAGLRCEELWLPGRWLSVLPDILRPFGEVFEELVSNIAGIGNSSNMENVEVSPSPIEAYAERMRGPLVDAPTTEEGPSVKEDGWPESYLQMLEQAESWEVYPYWLGPRDPEDWPFWRYRHCRWLGLAGVQLLWSAIDAAARIRAIATEAFHRGIPIRWFEFNTAAPSSGVSALQPINAREIARVRPRVGSILAMLALTVSNKESLVFWSPPTDRHPGVLFTADSDLANVPLPVQLDRAIVTAPHHGSEANANAYKAVAVATQNKASSITWVRSDGRYGRRPGNTYLRLVSRRLCTLCRRNGGGSIAKQTVHLYSSRGAWTRHQKSQVCSCQ
jgi:hypothetical protein